MSTSVVEVSCLLSSITSSHSGPTIMFPVPGVSVWGIFMFGPGLWDQQGHVAIDAASTSNATNSIRGAPLSLVGLFVSILTLLALPARLCGGLILGLAADWEPSRLTPQRFPHPLRRYEW